MNDPRLVTLFKIAFTLNLVTGAANFLFIPSLIPHKPPIPKPLWLLNGIILESTNRPT